MGSQQLPPIQTMDRPVGGAQVSSGTISPLVESDISNDRVDSRPQKIPTREKKKGSPSSAAGSLTAGVSWVLFHLACGMFIHPKFPRPFCLLPLLLFG